MQQQQQQADYDLLAVFSDEAKADTVSAKLHKEGFGEDEVYQLTEGSSGQGTYRVHGPSQERRDYFLQTRQSRPNPIVIALFAIIFGVVLGAVSFGAGTALPTMLPEPITLIAGIIIGLLLGAVIGFFRRGRVQGAIGQVPSTPSETKHGERNVIALRFNDPDNISRKSRARAILLNNQGKIDRSVGRRD
jgi:hypothetical protein